MFIYYLFVIYLFIFYLFHFYFYSYFFLLEGGGSPPADLEGTWELTWPSVRHTCLIPKHLQTLLLSNFASCQQREYTGSTLSIRPSACLWTKSCLLCIFHNTSQIHFIFTHEINQLQNVSHTLRLFKNSKIGIIFFLLIPLGHHVWPPLNVRFIRIYLNASDFTVFISFFIWKMALRGKVCHI